MSTKKLDRTTIKFRDGVEIPKSIEDYIYTLTGLRVLKKKNHEWVLSHGLMPLEKAEIRSSSYRTIIESFEDWFEEVEENQKEKAGVIL